MSEKINKNTAVIFTRNNARIVKFTDFDSIKEYANVVLNPNLTLVKGVPPHFWTLEDGFIIPMNDDQKSIRIKQIESMGIDNSVEDKRINELELLSLQQYLDSEKAEKEEEENYRKGIKMDVDSLSVNIVALQKKVDSNQVELINAIGAMSLDAAQKSTNMNSFISAIESSLSREIFAQKKFVKICFGSTWFILAGLLSYIILK